MSEIIKTENGAYLKLSYFGKIVDEEWYRSFEIRDELVLHEYILMPNHLHAIVEIKNTEFPLIHTAVCINGKKTRTINGKKTKSKYKIPTKMKTPFSISQTKSTQLSRSYPKELQRILFHFEVY